MMLPALAVLYGVVVVADVWITIKAVRLGIAKEANIILRSLVHKPILFIGLELALYAAFIGIVDYMHGYPATRVVSLVMLGGAIVWRGAILANNVAVVRRKK